ncbi:chemotaxis protein LafU [Paraliobacillus ryukyuensis]|uniref:Chemotaxis protein MotB n=1 Tax=Paraliobacillus ryukyuensis TaxID=200904 RepID=A0A366EAF8_9BACI|nr:flagellar motor protein MotS [Paraliobacillus ryukyuensis]RBO99363.1 chemotaxis protein MotB [Paraliobacillus ryukyuensis]
MKRRKKKIDKGAPKWMTTFSDMMTLILVFFILLFSMSQIDKVKFEAVAESFRNRMIFDTYPSPLKMDHPTENSEPREENEGAEERLNNLSASEAESENNKDEPKNSQVMDENQDSLDELLAEVRTFLRENDLENTITANRTDQGVVLILQERVLFDSGEAELKSSGKPFLQKVGLLLSNIPNEVRVEGHTDDRPISTMQYPSNWELSGARASRVIRYIADESNLEESRFIAVGYGDTRPIVKNSEENWSKNRRVEIVILELDEET